MRTGSYDFVADARCSKVCTGGRWGEKWVGWMCRDDNRMLSKSDRARGYACVGARTRLGHEVADCGEGGAREGGVKQGVHPLGREQSQSAHG